MQSWTDEFGAAITVVDRDLVIVEMNDKAKTTFEKYGGSQLLGKSLLDCHSESSKAIIKQIIETGIPHSYTIEKGGVRKMIHQAPWKKNGAIAGLVEISMEIPIDMEHFVRD